VIERFRGQILGVGSTSGVRVVVGRWLESPFGSFADAMIERPDGHRVLLAPSAEVAEFVASTYTFDEVRVERFVVVAEASGWTVVSPSLVLSSTFGRRTPLGWALRSVPPPVARSRRWASMVDPIARVALRGVRTRGVARAGRREYYGATDMHRVTAASGRYDCLGLGELAPVDPPCNFGFSSTPRTPSVTDVVTTVVTLT